ncbi:MAG: TetR/AcrR family transcriptional regulator [Tardiphaga sp.]|uniref:TetR/AcrR family transcriptional regulator n=1 Tax=Tardiphaga sp. TaxID=1926292 RepID=UPI0026106302|nr:TetR/AcrR family transcriptional regulator [Tardiphaga sp.]MDB5500565.1 TetR/AcrR family transcriptional regulator [Tardiphaga sp.]
MVQKENTPPAAAKPAAEPKRRGRPRAYAPEVALGQALALFRKGGFAATSLDDLSAATGMNRPSLYGAFGDKRELYIKAYRRYRDDYGAQLVDIFKADLGLRQRLARIFNVALETYLSGGDAPRGCFTVMTVASDAIADPDVRALAQDSVVGLDKAFARCFRIAAEKYELPKSADIATLSQIATATLFSLAIRARAGTPRPQLEAIVQGAIDLLCRDAV